MKILLICLGASAGALSRWQLSLWLNGGLWAWGTLFANWLGCLLIGILLAMNLHDSHRLLLITGFLGSFTTFSTFSSEVVAHITRGDYGSALIWVGLQVMGGIIGTIIGAYLAQIYFQAA